MTKIVFIGAGSVEFTRNVLSDLLTSPELGPLAISLHDVDGERLETASKMASWIAARTGAAARIESHPERRTALDGADYVVNEIQVGGYRATRLDFDIPARYGLRQTIADTIGIGGIFRGLRTVPVVVGIADDMAEVCPQALLLNYTNPMAMLPWAIQRGSRFQRVIGLCHSVRDTHRFLAGLVGVPVDQIAFVTAGVNHQAFVLTFEHKGQDLYPRLDRAIAGDPELARRVRVELYRRFGYFPTESSEHSAEYLPWFLRHDELVERFRIPVGDYLRISEDNLDEHADMKARLDNGRGFEIEPTQELASEVIHSIETGTRRVVYGNVPNRGLIENLPAGSCVEVPCLVDRAGMQPLRIGALPAQLAALNRTFLNVVELTVLAALEQRRDHVYQAAMLDPNTAATLTPDQIVALCDDLIEAHGDLIPEGIRKP
jgi:alpha-galactosidase